MKRHVPAAVAMLLAVVTPLFAQSIPVKVPSPTPSPSAAPAGETVAGRITQVDTKAGTFSVKANDSRKVLKLKAGDAVNVHQLRRGQRVEVTYSGGTATRVETTHSRR
jgi:C-terminal processing protease CtpA/Prc